MFILESKTQLEKAIVKAKKVRCKVKYVEFGTYKVSGTSRFYTVKCQRINNQKQVSCDCKGGLKGLVCYHSVSALALHTFLARQK